MSTSKRLGYIAGVGAIVCWASLAAAVGESIDHTPPGTTLAYGLTLAALVCGAWQWRARRRFWPGWRDALLGIYGIWLYHQLLLLALAWAPRAEANVLNYTWPLWIVLLGSFLPEQRWRMRLLLGAGCGLLGVMLIFGWHPLVVVEGNASALQSSSLLSPGKTLAKTFWGLGLALAAGLCWGSFSVLLRAWKVQERMGTFCVLAAVVAWGAVLMRGTPWRISLSEAWPILYLGLVPLGLAFILWDVAVARVDVQLLGVLSFFTPALSTLLLAWVSGSWPSATVWGGLALIMSGFALAAWPKARGSRRAR